MINKCKQTKADGSPCQASVQRDSDLCYFHDPTKATERSAGRVRGGIRSHRQARGIPDAKPPESIEEIKVLLSEVAAGAARGDVASNVANSVAKSCDILMKAILSERAPRQPGDKGVVHDDEFFRKLDAGELDEEDSVLDDLYKTLDEDSKELAGDEFGVGGSVGG